MTNDHAGGTSAMKYGTQNMDPTDDEEQLLVVGEGVNAKPREESYLSEVITKIRSTDIHVQFLNGRFQNYEYKYHIN